MVLSWEFAGRWGQLPLPLPDVAADGTDVLCAVAPGEGRQSSSPMSGPCAWLSSYGTHWTGPDSGGR